MNKTPSEALKLIEELKPLVKSDDVDVVFCVPAISLIPAVEAVKGTNIAIGAENMYFEEKGAFTGEIAPNMLTDAGVKYVIIGHSERREYFHECDCMLNKKVKKALEHGLTPILCCGETLEQFEAGTVVTAEMLKTKGVIAKIEPYGLKVLGNGTLTKAITVKAEKFTQSAIDKITAVGGVVEVK